MNVEVEVKTHKGSLLGVGVSEENLELLRVNFNPSNMKEIDFIKILGAAMMTVIDRYGEDPRTSAIARTNIETACMYAVKSMTAPVVERRKE